MISVNHLHISSFADLLNHLHDQNLSECVKYTQEIISFLRNYITNDIISQFLCLPLPHLQELYLVILYIGCK
jgi:hypothetical protein